MLDYEFFYIVSIPIYIFLITFLILRKVDKRRIIIGSIFFFYIITVIAATIFPIPIQGLQEIWLYMWWNSNNFMPFVSIFDILNNNNLDIFIKIKQVIGNIVLFIPMWFLIPFIWKSKNDFKKAMLLGFIATCSIEGLQFMISALLGFNYKITDIDDVILNMLGFIIGFVLHKIFQKSLIRK